MSKRRVRNPETYSQIKRGLGHVGEYRQRDSKGKKSMIWLEMLKQHSDFWVATHENKKTEASTINDKREFIATQNLISRLERVANILSSLYLNLRNQDVYGEYGKVIKDVKSLKLHKTRMDNQQKMAKALKLFDILLDKDSRGRSKALEDVADIIDAWDEAETRQELQDEQASRSREATSEIEWQNPATLDNQNSRNTDNQA
jgi:hypothetical protein